MSNQFRLTVGILSILLAMTLSPLARAATGSIEVNCEGVRFVGQVAENQLVRLEIRLHETADWQSPRLQDQRILVGPGPFDMTVPWADPDGDVNRQAFRVAISVSSNGGSTYEVLTVQEGILECEPPVGEGCTPGYWKNHLEDWAGLSPGDDFDETFGVNLFNPDITLDQAVNARGGGVNKLARHGTAALLSALHPDVAYPFSAAEVIALVQSGDIAPLVDANELGCSIP